jgi:hypothetical protein
MTTAGFAQHFAAEWIDAASSQGRDLQQAQVVLDIAGACGLP